MSNKTSAIFVLLLTAMLLAWTGDVFAFGDLGGACEKDCLKCHKITKEEASTLVKSVNPQIEVLSINTGPVNGLWELVIEGGGKKGLAYIDFSKQHIITGSIIKVDTKENLTGKRLYELSKVDVSDIPLDKALVMGKPDAKYRAIVFDDPD